METPILCAEEVYKIVGAAIEVHKELGPGFLEAVYQEALQIELADRAIPFTAQTDIPVRYKGNLLDKRYIADFLCFDQIIVELKAADKLTQKDASQVLNYLKAAELRVGVLMNFGSHGKLEWQRFVI